MSQTKYKRRFEMNAQFAVLTFLAVALGAMVYVVGMPWFSKKSHKNNHMRP